MSPVGLRRAFGKPGTQTSLALTPREMRERAHQHFALTPQEYYPVSFFESIGFRRRSCSLCKKNFWAKDGGREVCGDSGCQGRYTFIANKEIRGRFPEGLSYREAWEGFRRSLSSARVPCVPISPYPCVARWRDDVDYVAAGIYCFQPHCVTGEADPPANPLICPQFCIRFNDLENVGLTGRHYSGFTMLGIQVFNHPGKRHFWKEECVEFNYNWLKDELKLRDEEITFTEDTWAGGGNLGPSIEYFVHGMEIGNMVFMQYKTHLDGSLEELPIQVIDTGIGLERVAWLANGTPTSYDVVFQKSGRFLEERLGVDLGSSRRTMERLAPLSCRLDIEESEHGAWDGVAKELGMTKSLILDGIGPLKDFYTVLDHTRTAMAVIADGMLPSNTAGGYNVRHLLRRTLGILKRNGWWEKLGQEGLLELMRLHARELGQFNPRLSFGESAEAIVAFEIQKWLKSDSEQLRHLSKLTAKKSKLGLEDWYSLVTSLGIPADEIAAATGQPIPEDLYSYFEQQKSRQVKQKEPFWKDLSSYPATSCLYFDHIKEQKGLQSDQNFEAVVMGAFEDRGASQKSLLILDQTMFYPTSGGQDHDLGTLELASGDLLHVDRVEKYGPHVIHFLREPLTDDQVSFLSGNPALKGQVDMKRRNQLRNHHTATHLVFAASRHVLGSHIWQAGAKKTVEAAHVDITHYNSITEAELTQIEMLANQKILEGIPISKVWKPKEQAEKSHGFFLYQGGAVPGSHVRVVQIADFDAEACCGTHCDNTSQIGYIKILNSKKLADGVVRVNFVAGERAVQEAAREARTLRQASEVWSVTPDLIVRESAKKFEEVKRNRNDLRKLNSQLLDLQLVHFCLESDEKYPVIAAADFESPSFYFGFIDKNAQKVANSAKNLFIQGKSFSCGVIGDPASVALIQSLGHLSTRFPKLKVREVKVQGRDQAALLLTNVGAESIHALVSS